MRPTNAICCTVKPILDFHSSRLEHPSQGGDIIASLLPLENKVKSLGGGGDIPHSPTRFLSLIRHGSFSSLASGKMPLTAAK